MDLTQTLLDTADAFCRHRGLSHARLATIVANDGKFFDRVKNGGGLTVKMYERFMAYFREQDFPPKAVDEQKEKPEPPPVAQPAPPGKAA